MGANATQGTAVLVFLIAFTFLGLGFYYGASVPLIVLSLVIFAASAAMFLKCKPWEDMEN